MDAEVTYLKAGEIAAHYNEVGSDGLPIVILHGWGSSIASWVEVQAQLSARGLRTIAIDLPGFGKTDAPPSPWPLAEYTSFVEAFIREMKLEEFILLGHSFGGRIAIKIAAQQSAPGLRSLILTGAAGIRRSPTPKERAFAAAVSVGKAVLQVPGLRRMQGPFRKAVAFVGRNRDYYRVEGVMRDTMALVVEEDLTPILSAIQTPTLLIWGEKDQLTPLEDGVKMNSLIPNSTLKTVPDGSHRLPYEMPDLFAGLVMEGLRQAKGDDA